VFKLNRHIGNRNAKKIIRAVERYKADEGHYPAQLNDLVPEYMHGIPVCAYRISNNQYRYSYTDTAHYLMYANLPPYGRRVYHFRNQEWTYID
jgi:hypothetical protein